MNIWTFALLSSNDHQISQSMTSSSHTPFIDPFRSILTVNQVNYEIIHMSFFYFLLPHYIWPVSLADYRLDSKGTLMVWTTSKAKDLSGLQGAPAGFSAWLIPENFHEKRFNLWLFPKGLTLKVTGAHWRLLK